MRDGDLSEGGGVQGHRVVVGITRINETGREGASRSSIKGTCVICDVIS